MLRANTTSNRRRLAALALFALSFVSGARTADAQALRLRADAVAESPSPAGLVILQGQDKARPWLDAETLVWAGAKPDAASDVLVLALHAREPHGLGEIKAGRFVLATGAVRPVQLDGAELIGRTTWGSTVEGFGGLPVVPRFGERTYDWLAGGRVAQSMASSATLGVSYVQRRAGGEIANEEAGADLSFAPSKWFDLAARGSYDVTSPGISEASATASVRSTSTRFEVFASTRSPSLLIPATSLFSVLGDYPAQRAGAMILWRAAPRLDLFVTGAGKTNGFELGADASLRATLRLDDRGDGSLGLEVRREDVTGARWTGVRVVGAQLLPYGFHFGSEIEVAVPDFPDGHGFVWPWGLLSFGWRSRTGWDFAGAVEASSSPQYRYTTDALVRVGRVMEIL